MVENFQNSSEDAELMSSLAKGDSKAISAIYKMWYPSVEKMVFKMNGSTDDAYDVFQDSVTIVYEKAKAGDLQLNCRLSTYLIAVAKNCWLNKLTRRKKQPFTVLHTHLEESVSVTDDLSRFFEFENNVSRLNSCFEQIGEPCKSILQAFYLKNKSMNEIAQEFGYTNPENAKTQKYKCLNRIRKLFFGEQEKVTTNERFF